MIVLHVNRKHFDTFALTNETDYNHVFLRTILFSFFP